MSFYFNQNEVPEMVVADSQLFSLYMLACSEFAKLSKEFNDNLLSISCATIAKTFDQEPTDEDFQNQEDFEDEMLEALRVDTMTPEEEFEEFVEEIASLSDESDKEEFLDEEKSCTATMSATGCVTETQTGHATSVPTQISAANLIGAGASGETETTKEFNRLLSQLRRPFDKTNELSKLQKPFYESFIARQRGKEKGNPWESMNKAIQYQKTWCSVYDKYFQPSLTELKKFALDNSIEFDLDTVITTIWYPEDEAYANVKHEELLPLIYKNYSDNIQRSVDFKNKKSQTKPLTLSDYVASEYAKK